MRKIRGLSMDRDRTDAADRSYIRMSCRLTRSFAIHLFSVHFSLLPVVEVPIDEYYKDFPDDGETVQRR